MHQVRMHVLPDLSAISTAAMWPVCELTSTRLNFLICHTELKPQFVNFLDTVWVPILAWLLKPRQSQVMMVNEKLVVWGTCLQNWEIPVRRHRRQRQNQLRLKGLRWWLTLFITALFSKGLKCTMSLLAKIFAIALLYNLIFLFNFNNETEERKYCCTKLPAPCSDLNI